MYDYQQREYQQKELKTIGSLILEMVNKNRAHRRGVYVANTSYSLLTSYTHTVS